MTEALIIVGGGGHALSLADAALNAGVILSDIARVNSGAAVCSDCRLDGSVHVGAGATLIQGISVGAGAVIAAGAEVTTNVGPLTLLAGVAARELRRIHEQELA